MKRRHLWKGLIVAASLLATAAQAQAQDLLDGV